MWRATMQAPGGTYKAREFAAWVDCADWTRGMIEAASPPGKATFVDLLRAATPDRSWRAADAKYVFEIRTDAVMEAAGQMPTTGSTVTVTEDRSARLMRLILKAGGDALFRPSSIARNIKCAGSVSLSAGAPKQPPSDAIMEGTAMHKIAEDFLKGTRMPEEWVDRAIQVDKINCIWVKEEITDGARFYGDFVLSEMTPGTQLFVEHHMSLAEMDPLDPMMNENRGTSDAVLVNVAERWLKIIDLKGGKGVMVPGDSPQLKNYGLLGLLTFNHLVAGDWAFVETIVVQPRARSENQIIKRVRHDPASLLMDFTSELIGAMEQALTPNPPLHAGDHCHWCAGKADCPELRRSAISIARDAFDAAPLPVLNSSEVLPPMPPVALAPQEPVPQGTTVLPDPARLAPHECATIMERLPVFEMFATAVRQRAVAYIQAGATVPGWQMSQRTGHRRFKDPETAPARLRELGVKTAEMYTEPKLKSPAKIEKLIPLSQRDMLEELVERPLGEPTLMRADSTSKPPLITGFTPIPVELRG
jgi:Protein of unknown function (DUF2800)